MKSKLFLLLLALLPAALLAAEILAVSDEALAARLQARRAADTEAVLKKDAGIAERL